MSVSEHAVFACEFAGGGGDKRRSGNENHPCLSGFLLTNLPFTEMVTSPEMPLLVH